MRRNTLVAGLLFIPAVASAKTICETTPMMDGAEMVTCCQIETDICCYGIWHGGKHLGGWCDIGGEIVA